MAARCPALDSLVLRDCVLVTDEGIIRIAVGCRALSRLDLSGCHRVTGVGTAAVHAHNPALVLSRTNLTNVHGLVTATSL